MRPSTSALDSVTGAEHLVRDSVSRQIRDRGVFGVVTGATVVDAAADAVARYIHTLHRLKVRSLGHDE